ncbi:hypothetical protein CEXT_506551 [Caerostris extrusa]|uniref:Uncharacterized protein n=1 Tax=Caerostris extrusa TaxID=172846 RepID=A0AAV4S3A0_CAEEX|nr:hypothetical protein CEXT_506551 [Caerostris extrusa]
MIAMKLWNTWWLWNCGIDGSYGTREVKATMELGELMVVMELEKWRQLWNWGIDGSYGTRDVKATMELWN